MSRWLQLLPLAPKRPPWYMTSSVASVLCRGRWGPERDGQGSQFSPGRGLDFVFVLSVNSDPNNLHPASIPDPV